MKKVSIIVPVYNAEKTIERCVESLINQTYKNIEIILINDGSKDNSLKKLKEYELLYPKKVKVFSKKNSGAGLTRNKGIELASGEYALFVDSDDALELDAIFCLINNIKDNDIIIYGHKIISIDGKLLKILIPKDNYWSELKYNCTCSKLYKLSFLKENKILFPKIRIGEDIVFTLEAVSKTNKITILGESKYIVYKSESSITYDINNNNQIYNVNELINYVKNNIDTSKYSDLMIDFFLMKILVQSIILQLNRIDTKSLVKLYKKNAFLINKNGNIKLHYQKGEDFSINLIVNLFIFMNKIGILNFFLGILKVVEK